MKSTGNDIVALNAIDAQRTVNPAFYSKFVTPDELALYKLPHVSTIPLQNFVWLLWSVKESAYKYLQRLLPELIFPPARIIVNEILIGDGHYSGKVSFKDHQLFFRSVVTHEYISSVVNDTPAFSNVYSDVKWIEQIDNESLSAAVRELALEKLRSVLVADNPNIEKTEAGCPVVMQNEKLLDIPLSLAHHGYFIAYSFVV